MNFDDLAANAREPAAPQGRRCLTVTQGTPPNMATGAHVVIISTIRAPTGDRTTLRLPDVEVAVTGLHERA